MEYEERILPRVEDDVTIQRIVIMFIDESIELWKIIGHHDTNKKLENVP